MVQWLRGPEFSSQRSRLLLTIPVTQIQEGWCLLWPPWGLNTHGRAPLPPSHTNIHISEINLKWFKKMSISQERFFKTSWAMYHIFWGTNGKIGIVALAYNLSAGKAETGNFCEFECSLGWLHSKFKAWLGCLARPCFKKGKITERVYRNCWQKLHWNWHVFRVRTVQVELWNNL